MVTTLVIIPFTCGQFLSIGVLEFITGFEYLVPGRSFRFLRLADCFVVDTYYTSGVEVLRFIK